MNLLCNQIAVSQPCVSLLWVQADNSWVYAGGLRTGALAAQISRASYNTGNLRWLKKYCVKMLTCYVSGFRVMEDKVTHVMGIR